MKKQEIKNFVQAFRKETMIKSLNGELGNSIPAIMDLLNEFEEKYLNEEINL